MDKELTVRETARELGIRLDYLYQLIWAGKLEARREDGRWFISRGSVEARKKWISGRVRPKDGKLG